MKLIEMTPKERILAALTGKKKDRLPWSPNLAYWWEAQKDEIVNIGEVEFHKMFGGDAIIRGHYPMHGKNWEDMFLFKKKFKHTEITEKVIGDEKLTTYETSVGRLQYVHKFSVSGSTWFLQKHPVKTEEDFKVLSYIYDDMILEADYSRFEEAAARYSEEALLVPVLVPYSKTGFQAMVEFWVGTEELVYAEMDYPEAIEAALQSIRRISACAARIAADSKAEAFLTWEDTSTTNISPAYYEKYIIPEINEWCDILHASGKLYIQHACGHLNALAELIAKTGIDCIESISPPPTGNIELWDIKKVLPDNIALIGGIEPTSFLRLSIKEFEAYVENLLDKMKSFRYVVANSDSCPPGVELDKFKLVGKMLAR